MQMILISELSLCLLQRACVFHVLPSMVQLIPPRGEITILLAEAIIGSQGGGILHNLISTALTARLYSLFLNLPLTRKLFLGP